MKKIILLIGLCITFYSSVNAQISIEEPKCVSCKGNEISNISSALGVNNTATGDASFASGELNVNEGAYSTTLGYKNTATGMYSLAGGENSLASGKRSFAYGQFASAQGSRSLAIGKYVSAIGPNSVAIGRYVKTSTGDAMVLGIGNDTENYLENSINGSLIVGFYSKKATLFVGPSPSSNTSGNVGIGTTNPTQTLDVSGTFNVSGTSYLKTIRLSDSDIKYIDELQGNDGLKFKGKTLQTSTQMILTEDGKLGIGNLTPDHLLDVAGTLNATGDATFQSDVEVQGNSHLNGITLYDDADITGADKIVGFNDLRFSGDSDNGTDLFIASDGRIGIGTTDLQTGYLVSVDGQILAEEVKIQNSDQWYDFVFDDDYNLPHLSQLEGFIKQNKHLPDVPSAKQVSEEGINLGEMNGILLKKIEELTLYIIEQQKQIDELRERLDER